MARQLVKRRVNALLRRLFRRIERNPVHRWVAGLPFWARLLVGIPVFLFGFLAWLTPIPGGSVILVLSGVILFSFDRFERWFRYLLQRSRLVYWYGKRQERRRKKISSR